MREEREVLVYNGSELCDFAFGRDNVEQLENREEFEMVDDIKRCLSYEFSKAWRESNKCVTKYADFRITYKLKLVDGKGDPIYYGRPDFRDLNCCL